MALVRAPKRHRRAAQAPSKTTGELIVEFIKRRLATTHSPSNSPVYQQETSTFTPTAARPMTDAEYEAFYREQQKDTDA